VSEQQPDRIDGKHPIVAGLLALVGVGLAIGVVLGLVAVVGAKVLGVGSDSTASDSSKQASLYLPTPVHTTDAGEPQITLAPGGGGSKKSSESGEPADPTTSKTPEKKEISLSATSMTVGPMERFQLTGTYPQGEGAILTVQRFENGGWQDFPATGSVSGETFQIAVETSRPGTNRFRVVDTDSGLQSDEVRITVSG
jgi:hypothetical protein